MFASSIRSMRGIVRRVAMFALCVLAMGGSAATCEAQIRVACVGDSITAGYGLSDPGKQSYPAQLQALLGKDYKVENYGVSGATLLEKADYSYWKAWAMGPSLESKPDIVVIALGTNDSKRWNWDAERFNKDYKALIEKYAGLPTKPKVYICLVPPVILPTAFGDSFAPKMIQETVVPAIKQVATETKRPIIDNNTPLLNKPELFQDGVHPTVAGTAVIAAQVKAAIAP